MPPPSATCSGSPAVRLSIASATPSKRAIGLKAKKAELKQRGEQWLPWLQANAEVLGFGEAPERQAQRLMRAAEKYDAGVVFGEAEAVQISREIYGHLPPPSAVLRQRPTTVT